MIEINKSRRGWGEAWKSVSGRIAMTAFVVLLGLFIARFVLTASMYFIVAAGMAVVLGIVLARNLQLGVIGYFFLAAFAFGESPGVQSPNSAYKAGVMPSEAMLGFICAIWLIKVLFADNYKAAKSPVNLPLIVMGGISFTSMLSSNILRGTREQLFHQMLITQVAEVGLLFCSIFAFFLVANVLRDEKYIKAIFIPVILIGLYVAFFKITNHEYPVQVMWGSFILAGAISFVYSRLLFEKMSTWRRIFFVLLFLVLGYASFNDLSWISGWVAVGGALLVISWFRSKWLAAGLVTVALFAIFIYPGIYNQIQADSATGGDYDRFIIWRDAASMFLSVNPLLGVGPGNYAPYVYYHSSIWMGTGTYTTAHSNYMQIASEMGILGLLTFLWVIVAGILTGIKSMRTAPPQLKWIGASAAAVLSGMAVASFMGDYIFPSRGNGGLVNFGTTVYIWLIMGAAVAAANLKSSAAGETNQ